jgi:glycosyltransferase involved in cell wall biosynthesis
MSKELISIVTVVYNAENLLERTIQSVINQTYSHIEYIIIDGGSTDNTLNIINKYKQFIKYWISEKDKGIYDAMNKGTIHCNGEWIIYLNAGDVFYNENVLKNIFNRKYQKNTGCIFGDTYLINEMGDMHLDTVYPFWLQETPIKHKGICHQACFIHKEVAYKFPYDITYRISADFKLLVDIRKNNYAFYYCKIPVCIFERNGMSTRYYKLALKEDILISNIPYTFKEAFKLNIKQQKKRISYTIRKIILFLYKHHIKYFYRKLENRNMTKQLPIIKEGYV